MCGREAKEIGIRLDLLLFWANFYFFASFEIPFRLDSLLRARIETRSSISESLQCSLRLCDAVPNPYCFYDYLQNPMAEHKGIKEFCKASTWQIQPHSSLLPHFPNLTSFQSPNQNSDFLQVQAQPFFLLSIVYAFNLC